MSLGTGSPVLAGVARGDYGRAALPGNAGPSTAAAFEAAVQDVAAGTAAGRPGTATVPEGGAADQVDELPALGGPAPKPEEGIRSFEGPARGLVGWHFLTQLHVPAKMAADAAVRPGAGPSPEPIPASTAAPGEPAAGAGQVPAVQPTAAVPERPAASSAALTQPGVNEVLPRQPQPAVTIVRVDSAQPGRPAAAGLQTGPASGASSGPSAPVPARLVPAETTGAAGLPLHSPAPVVSPASDAPATAAPQTGAAIPAGAPLLVVQQQPAAASAALSTGPAAPTGPRIERGTPAAPAPAPAAETATAAAGTTGKTGQPGVPAAVPAGTAPAVRDHETGIAPQQGAVPPPGTSALPAAAPASLPAASPQTPGPTARMAPGSGIIWLAGTESAAADASIVPPPGVAPAPAAPAATPVPVPASGPPAASVSPAQLLSQVSQPLVRLAGAAPGEHVITLSVNPESLGPVTVRALISSDGVRVEIFAPTDTGREALRHILADLRRDLAGGSVGMAATLTLSDQNSPGNGSGGSAADAESFGRPRSAVADEPAEARAAAARPAETAPHRSGTTGTTPALDVMA